MSYLVEQTPCCDLLRLSLVTRRFVRFGRTHLAMSGLSRRRRPFRCVPLFFKNNQSSFCQFGTETVRGVREGALRRAVGRRFVRNMGCILRSRRTVRLCSVVRASYGLCVCVFVTILGYVLRSRRTVRGCPVVRASYGLSVGVCTVGFHSLFDCFIFFKVDCLMYFTLLFFSFFFLCPSSTIAWISISTIGLLRSIKIIMQNKI